MRARPDQRHVAADHIYELRQPVEAQPTQDAPQARDARIVSYCPLRPGRVGAIDMHCAEFEHSNHLIVETGPQLRSGGRHIHRFQVFANRDPLSCITLTRLR